MQSFVLCLALFGTHAFSSPIANSLAELEKLYPRSDAAAADLSTRQTGAEPCPDPLNTPWDVDDYTCPAANSLDSNGACTAGLKNQGGITGVYCTAYCQIKSTWFPGPEAPFENTECSSGDGCTLAQSKTTTVTNGYSINVGISTKKNKRDDAPDASELELTFNAGASYTFSESVAYATTTTHTRNANQTAIDCGYFTFVPYYLT